MTRVNKDGKKAVLPRLAVWIGAMLLVTRLAVAERLPIKIYTTADGLARDQITRIVRDSRGFLWFCTPEGLSRFDGYSFINYTTNDGLPHPSVRDLLETRDGTYWIATGDGLCRFNPRGRRRSVATTRDQKPNTIRSQATSNGPGTTTQSLFTVFHPGESEAARRVTVLFEDHAGTVWVGTWAGLFRLEQAGGRVKFHFVEMGMPSETVDDRMVEDILEDRRGALWIATRGSGLYRRWPDGRVEHYTAQNGLPSNRVHALLEDRDGRLWAGTTHGLCLLNAEFRISDFELRNGKSAIPNAVVAHIYTRKDFGLPSEWVLSLFQSSDGHLWIGLNHGLSKFIPSSRTEDQGRKLDPSSPVIGFQSRTYTTAHGLSDNEIGALAEDREGNLWIGTTYGGAMKLARSGFVTYLKADSFDDTNVSSLVEDRAGELCVFTKNSSGQLFIYRFDGRRFIAARPDFPKRITYFGWGWNQIGFQDRTGEWWIATGQGLCRFPKVSHVEQLAHTPPKAIYTTRDGLIADDVFRLFEDSRGDIWISSFSLVRSGLIRWERATKTFHRYTEADGLPPPTWTAEAFSEDRSGNVWIGIGGKGLARYMGNRFTLFTASDGLPRGIIRALHVDRAGRLWIGCDQGLSRIDNPTAPRPRFVTYTTADGLSSNQISSCITEDRRGNIYIGTGRGIDRLDPATGRIKHYTTADGLARGHPIAAFSDRQGALWFCTNSGLSRFLPEPNSPLSPPPIRISGLRIAGELYPVSELGETSVSNITLGPNENQLQIEFSSLRFGLGESLRYEYKLEGADRGWNALTDQRTVHYAKLAPGKYRFMVRAVNSDGTPSPTPATVAFTVLPPIWQRWWFLLLVTMVVGFAAYFIYRVRVARLIEMERVRTRIATDLHDEIGSNLSFIAMLGEVANRHVSPDDPRMARWLSLIASTSRETVDSMSDIVWAVNPQKDSLGDLTQRMRRVAEENFSARNIAFQFSVPGQETDIALGAETRREIFKIFKESLNNIVRHAHCTQAVIEFRVEAGRLVLKLSDNGQGFDPDRATEGNGLMNMRRRAKNLGGELEVISQPDVGTTVILKVPLQGHRK